MVLPCTEVLCSWLTGSVDAYCWLVLLLRGIPELKLGLPVEDEQTQITEGKKVSSSDKFDESIVVPIYQQHTLTVSCLWKKTGAGIAYTETFDRCKLVADKPWKKTLTTWKIQTGIISWSFTVYPMDCETVVDFKECVMKDISEGKMKPKVTNVERRHLIELKNVEKVRTVFLRFLQL